MAEKEAKFRFVNYQILESSIKIDSDQVPNQKLQVDFEQTIGVDDGERKMRLLFSTKIQDENAFVSLFVRAEGFFEFDVDLPEEHKDVFFKANAPAILFPYIRSYITTLTALSGIPPIILPTLNLSQR